MIQIMILGKRLNSSKVLVTQNNESSDMTKSRDWFCNMAYSLRVIHDKFVKEVNALNSIVHRLESTPECLERDTHIEGCYIRFVVCWECFIEEFFLRCLCGAKTRNNSKIKPREAPVKNTNEAFKKINKHRRDRDKDYIDWLDSDLVEQRVNDFFRANSRVQKLCESPDKLYEVKIIRNAIAHRSVSALLKFEKMVKDQMGYLATLDPTMASLLIQKRRNTNVLIFTTSTNYFLGLADRLTK